MSDANIEYQDIESINEEEPVFFYPAGPLKSELIFVYVSGVIAALWSFIWVGFAADASGKWPLNFSNFSLDIDNQWNEGIVNSWNSAQGRLDSWQQFGVFVLAIFVLSQIVWSYKAHLFAEEKDGAKRKWRRGWSIGGWFTPIGFLFIPYLVIRETESLICGKQKRNSWLGPIWFVFSWFVIFGIRVTRDGNAFDQSNMTSLYKVIYLTGAVLVCTVLFALTYFGHISYEAFAKEQLVDPSSDRMNLSQNSSTGAEDAADGLLIGEQIRMLGKLHAEGHLSDAEFSSKKKDLLGRM